MYIAAQAKDFPIKLFSYILNFSLNSIINNYVCDNCSYLCQYRQEPFQSCSTDRVHTLSRLRELGFLYPYSQVSTFLVSLQSLET